MEKIVPGSAGGQHVAGAPLTIANTATVSPDLLRNAIDERIARIRPMSTPSTNSRAVPALDNATR